MACSEVVVVAPLSILPKVEAAPCSKEGVVVLVVDAVDVAVDVAVGVGVGLVGFDRLFSSNEVSFWTGLEREKVFMVVGRIGEEKGLLL